jgi:hypothetical protein
MQKELNQINQRGLSRSAKLNDLKRRAAGQKLGEQPRPSMKEKPTLDSPSSGFIPHNKDPLHANRRLLGLQNSLGNHEITNSKTCFHPVTNAPMPCSSAYKLEELTYG